MVVKIYDISDLSAAAEHLQLHLNLLNASSKAIPATRPLPVPYIHVSRRGKAGVTHPWCYVVLLFLKASCFPIRGKKQLRMYSVLSLHLASSLLENIPHLCLGPKTPTLRYLLLWFPEAEQLTISHIYLRFSRIIFPQSLLSSAQLAPPWTTSPPISIRKVLQTPLDYLQLESFRSN